MSDSWFNDEYRRRQSAVQREAWGHDHELAPMVSMEQAQAGEAHWCLRCGFPKVPEGTVVASDPNREYRNADEFICLDCLAVLVRQAGLIDGL